MLQILVERPGEVVTREEIRQKLWPNDTIVEFDNSINAAIKKLRLALGEMSTLLLDGQKAIPKRLLDAGYAFQHPSVEGALASLLTRP